MVDVYDGRFPSSRPNIFSRSKDNTDGEQEERRLFYVGITRAKNKLSLFDIKGKESSFIDQLFPKQKMIREQEEEEKRIENLQSHAEQERILQRLQQEELEKERRKVLEIEKVRQKQIAKIRYINSYNEVKDKFTQQEFQIRDSSGRRWIECELCGEIKLESEFGLYGGANRVNLGLCYQCLRRDKQ